MKKIQTFIFWGVMFITFPVLSQVDVPKDFPVKQDTGRPEEDEAKYLKAKAEWIAKNAEMYNNMTSTNVPKSEKEVTKPAYDEAKYVTFDFKNTTLMTMFKVECEDKEQGEKFAEEVFVLDMKNGFLYRQSHSNPDKARFFKFLVQNESKLVFHNCDNCTEVILHYNTESLVVLKIKEHADDAHYIYAHFGYKNQ